MDSASDNMFSYCTRCGHKVDAYRGRQEGGSPNLYDEPVATADRSEKRGTEYTCSVCQVAWRALDLVETGWVWACGHFMPCNVQYCGVCGLAVEIDRRTPEI